jgi:hypothetical protein
MAIRNPALYAVVAPVRQTPAPKRIHKVAARIERSAEIDVKAQIDRVVAVLDKLEARAAAYKKQAAALKRRQALTEARQQRIEEWVLDRMGKANVVLAPGFKRTLKANLCPQSVEIVSEDDIPAMFRREKTTTAPDKVFISRTLSLGFVVTDDAALPRQFRLRGGDADEQAIKAALARAVDVAGVMEVLEIPGVRLVQRTTLQRS